MIDVRLSASEMMASSSVNKGSNTPAGIETSCIENRVLGMEIAGNRFFEFAVQVLRPANEPYRRHAESVGIHRLFRGGDEPGIVG